MNQNLQTNSTANVTVRTNAEFEAMKTAARTNNRKRTLQMLHPSHEAELHSMINVFTPGSYTAPHRHLIELIDGKTIRKGESFIALEGKGKIILFDDNGNVIRTIELDAAEQTMVWIPADVWHAVVCLSDAFIVFENKTGPWKEGEDKLFHSGFPAEGDESAALLVKEWELL